MSNLKVNLDLQKALINHALKNGDITESQYNRILNDIDNKKEELRLQNKLKEYKNKEIIKRYSEHSLV